MDQRKLDGVKPSRAWFVQTSAFGSMMPWSWQGWLWIAIIMEGAIASSVQARKHGPHEDLWPAGFAICIVIGICVAAAKCERR